MHWELVSEAFEPQAASPGGQLIKPQAEGRPRGHSFSAHIIRTAVTLVLVANSTLRGAAHALRICGVLADDSCPSFSSIRNWVLRLGLYELQRSKAMASDWVFIMDHTIQLGPHKALLVLGVRLGELIRRDFQMGHQDVEVLGLEICEQSNGLKVLEILETISKRTGVPRALVSDAGSDIKKGAELFCGEHAGTDWIPDVGHRMARLLECELKDDPRWQNFLSQAAACRSQCQQTGLSPLMPPAQRSKARWMNFKPLISWGLNVIGNPVPEWADPKQFERLFGWLDDYQDELNEYWMMMHMGEETCRILKQGGIDAERLKQCEAMLQEFAHGSRLRRHARGIRNYLQEVETKLSAGERLLGSSDIIESIFGKYKAVVERSPQKAISQIILLIGALASDRTDEVIERAMEAVPMQSVKNWFKEYIPKTARSLRKKAFA